MYCQNCGAAVAENASRCHQCGSPPLRTYLSEDIGNDPAMRLLLPVGRSPWAIAAGYAGLFAFTVILAPLALILGVVAIRDLKAHPERHGMGRAIFGTATGAIGTLLILIVVVVAALGNK